MFHCLMESQAVFLGTHGYGVGYSGEFSVLMEFVRTGACDVYAFSLKDCDSGNMCVQGKICSGKQQKDFPFAQVMYD